MDIDIARYNQLNDHTDGMMFINGEFQCFTLEDAKRTQKVYGKTRVPNGTYKIELRTEGGFHNRYLEKYGPDFHKGMLWVKDVPNFEYILIHLGNDTDDTAGCLLVGMIQDADNNDFLGKSGVAYEKIYPIIRDAILSGEDVWINYFDFNGIH